MVKTFEDVRARIRASFDLCPGGHLRSINADPAWPEATRPALGQAVRPDAEMRAKLLARHAEQGDPDICRQTIEVSASVWPAGSVGHD